MFKIKLYSRKLIRGKILKTYLLQLFALTVILSAAICLILSVFCFIYTADEVLDEFLFYAALRRIPRFAAAVPYLLLAAFIILTVFFFSFSAYRKAVFYCRINKDAVSPKSFLGIKTGVKYMWLCLCVFSVKLAVFSVFFAPFIITLFCFLLFIDAGIERQAFFTGAVFTASLLPAGGITALFVSKGADLCYVSFFKNRNKTTAQHIKAGMTSAHGSYLKLARTEISLLPWKLLCIFIFPIPFVYSYTNQTKALIQLTIGKKIT